jgi:hypothetical protein
MTTPEYCLVLEGLQQNVKRVQGEHIPGVIKRHGEAVDNHIIISKLNRTSPMFHLV